VLKDLVSGQQRDKAHIDLDIEVLKVEGVLPDVHTDDWDQIQERVLVSTRGDLQTLGGGVESLITKISRYHSNPMFT